MTKVLIEVRGGCVVSAYAIGGAVDICVVDYDGEERTGLRAECESWFTDGETAGHFLRRAEKLPCKII